MDPFGGNRQDPQSLHKYAYCHNNPTNGIDPSGNFTLAGQISVISITSVMYAIIGIAFVDAATKGKVTAGISLYIKYMLSFETWKIAAAKILEGLKSLFTDAVEFILFLLETIFSAVFAIVGVISNIYQVFSTANVVGQIFSAGVSLEESVFTVAVLTAVMLLGLLIGKVVKKVLELGSRVVTKARLVVGGGQAEGFPDLEPGDLSLNIDPEADPHIIGDIRNVDLGDQFDEIFFERVPYTAIDENAIQNSAKHLVPGGELSIITGSGAFDVQDQMNRNLTDAGFTNIQWDTDYGPGSPTIINANLGG